LSQNPNDNILDNDKSEFNFIPPLDIKTEEKCLLYLKKQTEEYLVKYPNTIEEDNNLLSSISLSINEKNCILMRKGEKEILEYYIKFTTYCLELLKIRDIKEIKKKIKKDFKNNIFPYESYLNDVILYLVKTEHFKENN
jgi:histone-lysine N-methyltransferase SETD3